MAMKDPTRTATKRMYWTRQLRNMYRNYANDVESLARLDRTLREFNMGIEALSLSTHPQSVLIAETMTLEGYTGGITRAEHIIKSLIRVGDLTGSDIILGAPGALGPADLQAIDLLQQTVFDSIEGMTSEIEHKIKFRMSQGMLKGESNLQIARDLKKYTNAQLWRANRIVRTEYIRSTNDSAAIRYQQYGYTCFGVSVEDADPECPICPPKRGRTFRFGQDEIPPFHPNCRCSIFPKECK